MTGEKQQLGVRRARHSDDPDGWGQWDVLDTDGRVVGAVAEHHQWEGTHHGPVRYDVACRPQPMPASACWNSYDTATTIPEALKLLEEHHRSEHPR